MKKLIILGVILGFIVGCSNNHQVNIEDKWVLDLYKSVNPSEDAIVLDKQYKSANNDFDNEYILAVGIKSYLSSHSNVEIIDKKDIEENIDKILGKNINFKHGKAYILWENYCGFNYDEELEQYKIIDGCSGATNDFYFRKLVGAKKERDRLILTEKLVYVFVDWEKEPHKVAVYNNSVDKNLIKKYDINNDDISVDINDYIKEASTYNYIFEMTNNNYILKKIELVK